MFMHVIMYQTPHNHYSVFLASKKTKLFSDSSEIASLYYVAFKRPKCCCGCDVACFVHLWPYGNYAKLSMLGRHPFPVEKAG